MMKNKTKNLIIFILVNLLALLNLATISFATNLSEENTSEVNVEQVATKSKINYKKIEKIGIDRNDQYFFDNEEELAELVKDLGYDPLPILDKTIMIGDSHLDRLTRSITPYLHLNCKQRSTLRRLEKEINIAILSGYDNLLIYTGNNEVLEQTDLYEFENELNYIHSLTILNNFKNVFFTTYLSNVIEIDLQGIPIQNKDSDYTNVIKKVCAKYDNFHYIDIYDLYSPRLITQDLHMNYVFNKKALRVIIKEIKKWS